MWAVDSGGWLCVIAGSPTMPLGWGRLRTRRGGGPRGTFLSFAVNLKRLWKMKSTNNNNNNTSSTYRNRHTDPKIHMAIPGAHNSQHNLETEQSWRAHASQLQSLEVISGLLASGQTRTSRNKPCRIQSIGFQHGRRYDSMRKNRLVSRTTTRPHAEWSWTPPSQRARQWTQNGPSTWR